MKRYTFFSIVAMAIVLLCAGVSAKTPQGFAFFTRLSSFAYSDAMPVDQLLRDFEGDPPDNGDIAFTHNEWRVGFAHNTLEFSVFQRYDDYFNYNSDTAELLYVSENNLPVEQNRAYEVDLEANRLKARGLSLGYKHLFNKNLDIAFTVSYLNANALLEGRLNGEIITREDSYDGELFVDYDYTEDLLFDREVDPSDGEGFSLDARIRWQLHERMVLRLDLEDLVNEITWKSSPYTQARVTSNTVEFNEDGSINTTPVLSGVEGYRDVTQRLPLRGDLRLAYVIGPRYSAIVRWQRYDKYDYPSAGMAFNIKDDLSLSATYNIEMRSLALSVEHSMLSFQLLSDALEFDQAKALGLQFALKWPTL